MFDPEKGQELNREYNMRGGLSWETDRKKPTVSGDNYMRDLATSPSSMDPKQRVAMLDSALSMQLHGTMLGHFVHELDRQAENRLEMAMDEDFYDHIQYTEEELATLAARGQAPVVYNLIQTTVNWVLGSQRRSQMDYRILPRKKVGLDSAERKTQLMKHVSDENLSEYEWSDAFRDAVRAGVGWMETGQGRPDEAIVFDRNESWRSMLWDTTSRRYDLQDSRYLFRAKWLDLDVAASLWPQRQGIIASAAQASTTGFYADDTLGDEVMDSIEMEHFHTIGGLGRMTNGAARERVRVVEAWFKRPVPEIPVLKGGQFNGELFDEWSPGHWNEVNSGSATLALRPKEVIFVALMTETGLLDLRRSPYRHNRYPFTPLWGNRRARDGMPYGLIRGLRDMQRSFNKRTAKALHHMSATRVTVEEGAVEDIDVLRDEAARPDAVIVHKAGHPAPQIESDLNMATTHLEFASRDAELIQAVGGVTDENLGRKTNATSGKAIVARQDQGALATSTFFDNLRRSRMIHGEKQLVNIEQFYTDEDELRITDTRGNPDYVPINDGDPKNAIALHKADFIITEDEWRASVRQAQADQLLDLGGKLAATAPDLVVGILDLIVEALDVPKRDEMVKRIRQLTNQDDPDADPNKPDPEMLARKQAAQEEAAMQRRGMEAEISEKEAKSRKTLAEALRAEGQISGDAVATMRAAFDAAIQIAGAPAVAAAADRVLSEAMAAARSLEQRPAPAPAPAQPPAQPPAPAADPMMADAMGAQPPAEGL